MSAELAAAKVADNANNAFGRMTVPQFRWTCRVPGTAHDFVECVENPPLVGSHHNIGSLCDGDGAFGIVSKRQTRDSQYRGFFLKTSGICQHNRRGGFKVEELQIAKRIHRSNSIHRQSELLYALCRS